MKMNINRTMAMKDEADETKTSPIFLSEDRYRNTLNRRNTRNALSTWRLSMDLSEGTIGVWCCRQMGSLVVATDELEGEFDEGKDDDDGVEDVEAIGTVTPPAQSDEFGDELHSEESSEDDVGDGKEGF